MSAETKSVRILVSGRVQGVGFRAFVRDEAVRRGVRGWVRNLRDGRVEAVLSGDAAQVDETLDSIRSGPRFSNVSDVDVRDDADAFLTAFEICATP